MEKKEMLKLLVFYFCGGNKAKFAAKLGLKPQALSMWFSRNSFDAELIFKKCEGVSARWLLSGEGDMIESAEQNAIASGANCVAAIQSTVSQGDSAVLQERVRLLEKLLDEKERTIKILMDK